MCLSLLLSCPLAFHTFKLSVLFFSLPYFIMSSSIDHLRTHKSLELSSLPLHSKAALTNMFCASF